MHMSFKFRDTPGCGLAKCLPQASAHFLDVLAGLLEYDPDERMSARQAIRHPYFADQRQLDSTRRAQPPPGVVEPPPEAKKKTASLKRVDPSPLPAREQRKNGKVLPAVSSKPQPVRNPQQVRRGPKRPPRIVHHPLLHPNNAAPERKWQAAAPRVSGTHKTNKVCCAQRVHDAMQPHSGPHRGGCLPIVLRPTRTCRDSSSRAHIRIRTWFARKHAFLQNRALSSPPWS
jgi:serine/threonine protein kinase